MKLTAEQIRKCANRECQECDRLNNGIRTECECRADLLNQAADHIAQFEAELGKRDDLLNKRNDLLNEKSAEIKRLREAERWTPVGERMPEHNGFVLTYLDIGICDIAHYNKHIWHGECVEGVVTHWRPLPQPPEAKGGQRCKHKTNDGHCILHSAPTTTEYCIDGPCPDEAYT